MNNLLSLIVWIPLFFGVLVLIFFKNDYFAKAIALLGSSLAFAYSLLLYVEFNNTTPLMQFSEFSSWIVSLNINYHLGVDGISMPLLVLNNFITVLVILAGFKVIKQQVALYNSMFLLMSGLISGTFCALDAILFYVFFEAMLIPMYLIIGIWGSDNRVYAAIKFFLYTLLGSLLMLVALIYLYFHSNYSFEILNYYKTQLTLIPQLLLFGAFFLSFAVKVPMWPLHTWLPDAHPEAPTGGSMVLAAITLKIGAYGFFRFILPIVPDAARYLATPMVILSLIAIVYIGLIAIIQKDMKRLVAYSSIAHMGFVTLGCFLFVGNSLNIWALQGALTQMVSHGFISAAMFMAIGVMYDRVHSRNINDYGGVVNKMPIFAAFFMFFAMANCGLPGTSGFVGEFMVIMASAKVNFIYTIIAASTLVLGASYTLWMYKRVVFGEINNFKVAEMKDLDCREVLILGILAIMVLVVGLYPQILLNKVDVATKVLIDQVNHSKLTV